MAGTFSGAPRRAARSSNTEAALAGFKAIYSGHCGAYGASRSKFLIVSASLNSTSKTDIAARSAAFAPFISPGARGPLRLTKYDAALLLALASTFFCCAILTAAMALFDDSAWYAVATMVGIGVVVASFLSQAKKQKHFAFNRFADAFLDCRTIMTGVDPRRRSQRKSR